MIILKIDIPTQQMRVYENNTLVKIYNISTGKNGVGELSGSEKDSARLAYYSGQDR